MKKILVSLIIAFLLSFLSISISAKEKKDKIPDNWALSTDNYQNYHRSYLGNGYMGIKIPIEGTGWIAKEEELPSTCIGGIYDVYDDADKIPEIVNLPSWSNIGFNDGETYFDTQSGSIEKFSQRLNMKDGYMQTSIKWKNKGKTTDMDIIVFVCRDKPHLGVVKYKIRPDWSGSAYFTSTIDGSFSKQYEEEDKGFDLKEKLIWLNVKTTGGIAITETAAMEFKGISKVELTADTLTKKRVGLNFKFNVQKGKEYICFKYVSFLTSLDSKNLRSEAKIGALKGREAGYSQLFKEHIRAWHNLWQTDIIIDGDDELQRIIHSSLFYLLGSIREDVYRGIAGAGLSETKLKWAPYNYTGHIFWDMDAFMFPPLLLMHPEFARTLVMYRYRTLEGARKEAKAHGYKGAEYAWESAFSGKEVAPRWATHGEFQIHIGGWVALSAWWYYLATDDITWLKSYGFPVIYDTARFWAERVEYNKDKDRYEIHSVTPPSEFPINVKNCALTNAIAAVNLQIGIKACKLLKVEYPKKWLEIINKMFIPYDEKEELFLHYEGGLSSLGIPGVPFLIHPLEWPLMDKRIRLKNLLYHSKKSSRGHSEIPLSIGFAEVGEVALAYEHFRKIYKPYLRPPFNMLSEQSKTTRIPCYMMFASGTLQSLLYGFLGFRWREDELYLMPVLADNWKQIEYKGLKWKGRELNLKINQAKVSLMIKEVKDKRQSPVQVRIWDYSFRARPNHQYEVTIK